MAAAEGLVAVQSGVLGVGVSSGPGAAVGARDPAPCSGGVSVRVLRAGVAPSPALSFAFRFLGGIPAGLYKSRWGSV